MHKHVGSAPIYDLMAQKDDLLNFTATSNTELMLQVTESLNYKVLHDQFVLKCSRKLPISGPIFITEA
jgi:hypothetical protein